MTHNEGSPWDVTRKKNPGIKNADIQNDVLMDYFSRFIKKKKRRMSDDVEFSADVAAPSKLASPTALKEQSVIEAGSPAPNSVIIKLWKGGHLCFNPDNHTSIFH